MTTRRFKPNAKPSGVLGSTKVDGRCKTRNGTRDHHTPVDTPFHSTGLIIRSICTGCGKVIDWKAS